MKTFFSVPPSRLWLALLPLLNAAAQAQPDVQNAPKATNPTNRPVRPNLQNLAPEARQKERQRRQFEIMGATTTAVQNALLAYIEAENLARQPLLLQARQLQIGLLGDALSDAQVTAQLNDYLAALEEDKTRRETAQTALKKAVDLPKMPKIEAMLTLMGLYGNAPALLPAQMMNLNARALLQNGALAPANGPQPTRPRINRRRFDAPPAQAPAAPPNVPGAQA